MAAITHTEKYVPGQVLSVNADNAATLDLNKRLELQQRLAKAAEDKEKRKQQADAATKKRFSVFG